jgi:hypothetical protein
MHGFLRADPSVQAVLLLAERGLIGDARTVLRSAIEGTHRDLCARPHLRQRLIEAHHTNQRKIAHLLLGNQQRLATYDAADVAAIARHHRGRRDGGRV